VGADIEKIFMGYPTFDILFFKSNIGENVAGPKISFSNVGLGQVSIF
jgi:hypothetical protein